MCTGFERYGVVVWFGKYTDIASLVLLFGFTLPSLEATWLAVGVDKCVHV